MVYIRPAKGESLTIFVCDLCIMEAPFPEPSPMQVPAVRTPVVSAARGTDEVEGDLAALMLLDIEISTREVSLAPFPFPG